MSSVQDPRFGSGPPFTVGVEEEYMLLDPVTFDLVQRADSLLALAHDPELAERLAPELFQSLLEVHTPVCSTTAEADQELRRLRTHVAELAGILELRVGSAGTHPFSLFERQRVTRRNRYNALIDQLQYIARRELIFGLHVHVAVDDADKAVAIMGALTGHLSELVALTANSPFWRGLPTGLHSSRQSDLRGVPALRAAALLRQLRRVRRRRRPGSRRPGASPSTRTSGGTSGRTRASGRSRSA